MINKGMGEFPPGGPSKFVVTSQHLASKFFMLAPAIARKFAHIGEVADFMRWLQNRFLHVSLTARREEVWTLVLDRLSGKRVRGFEFGVAWGYASKWWLDHVDGREFRWEGFDRFTGLPRGWREFSEGHFDAGGTPPHSGREGHVARGGRRNHSS